MKKAVKIVLERWEGTHAECDGKHVIEGGNVWEKANAMLRRWAWTSPRGGGYHKCGFEITWDDGDTYEGRVELSRDRSETLEAHIRSHCEFHAGRAEHPWMGEKRYRAFLRDAVKPEAMLAYAAVLDECELGWVEPSASAQEAWLQALGAIA